MPPNLDIFTSVLGEDVPGQRRLLPRGSLHEAAHARIHRTSAPVDFCRHPPTHRLLTAMRSRNRTHGTPRL